MLLFDGLRNREYIRQNLNFALKGGNHDTITITAHLLRSFTLLYRPNTNKHKYFFFHLLTKVSRNIFIT